MAVGLKVKANFAFSLALIALAVMAWFSIRASRHYADADRQVAHSHAVLETSASLRSELTNMNVARREVLQGNKQRITVFNRAIESSLTLFNTLVGLTADNTEQQNRLRALAPILNSRLDVQKTLIQFYEQKKPVAAQDALNDRNLKLAAEFSAGIQKFDDAEKMLLDEHSAKAQEENRQTTRADTLLSISAFLFLMMAVGALNRELSHRAKTEEAIAQQKVLLQSILNACNDAVVVVDPSAKVILRNPASFQLQGELPPDLPFDEVPARIGYYKSDGITAFPYEELPMVRALRGESTDNVEMCVRRSGEEGSQWVLGTGRQLRNESGKIYGGMVFYRNITDRKKLENEIIRRAEVDELTGLHNRRGFLSHAEQTITLIRLGRRNFALIFVDVDGLKSINDTLGHAVGDRAIVDAASILKDTFRQSDVLCRLGGDEFAVLMTNGGNEGAEVVRKRLAEKLTAFNQAADRPYALSLSIGILLCGFDETRPLEILLGQADSLMYEQKREKRLART